MGIHHTSELTKALSEAPRVLDPKKYPSLVVPRASKLLILYGNSLPNLSISLHSIHRLLNNDVAWS